MLNGITIHLSVKDLLDIDGIRDLVQRSALEGFESLTFEPESFRIKGSEARHVNFPRQPNDPDTDEVVFYAYVEVADAQEA